MSTEEAVERGDGSVLLVGLFFVGTLFAMVPIYATTTAVYQFTLPDFYVSFPRTLDRPLISGIVAGLIVACHLVMLRPAREQYVGWTLPVAAVILLSLETFAATFLLSVEQMRPVDLVPADSWAFAGQAADLALLAGLALIAACTLLLPLAARAESRPIWRLLHHVLLGLFAMYSVVPVVLML